MSYCTISDLKNAKYEVWDSLKNGDELIVLNNGLPRAIIIGVDNDNVDIIIKAVRRARAMISFSNIRKRIADIGYMDDEEINKEIIDAKKKQKFKINIDKNIKFNYNICDSEF